MPGYAYPVGATADTVPVKSVTLDVATTLGATDKFTAVKKTRVNSILVTNTTNGILPVNLYVYRSAEAAHFLLSRVRVLDTKYAMLPLVSGDTRVSDSLTEETARPSLLTEIVLGVNDYIYGICPVATAIILTVGVSEGVK